MCILAIKLYFVCNKCIFLILDHYKNQTFKMMTAINYISDYCYSPRLILRIDDDVIFHPGLMIKKLIYNMSGKAVPKEKAALKTIPPRTVACHLREGGAIRRMKDYPKYYGAVPDSILPGEEFYPPFCAGFFVAMSGDVPAAIRPYFNKYEPFWMDDRYMAVLHKPASIRNALINFQLDYGYREISRKDMIDLIQGRVYARHLPKNQKSYIWELFYLLNQANNGSKVRFKKIEYYKYPWCKTVTAENWPC